MICAGFSVDKRQSLSRLSVLLRRRVLSNEMLQEPDSKDVCAVEAVLTEVVESVESVIDSVDSGWVSGTVHWNNQSLT